MPLMPFFRRRFRLPPPPPPPHYRRYLRADIRLSPVSPPPIPPPRRATLCCRRSPAAQLFRRCRLYAAASAAMARFLSRDDAAITLIAARAMPRRLYAGDIDMPP